ncbi:MAG: glycosyltransferase family 4 protein [Candidatus Aminicenantes bacterium]|jgi:glycosyltransferase involved in cell wall biosynthesis
MIGQKRIAVITSDVPFVEGGHLTIARSTVNALNEYGYEADLILTPQNRFGRQLRAYLANRFTDVEEDGLGRAIHQIITFRFPSYAVKHAQHVCWLNHRLREYYDQWTFLHAQLGVKGKLKEGMRRHLIHALDAHLLKHNVTKLYAQSRTIQKRLERWGRISSEVLYPPPPQRNYHTESYDNFIFSVSRLQRLKRLDLLVESFNHVKNKNLKAIIVGEGPEEKDILQKIKDYHLEERVTLLGKSEEKMVLDLFATCRAVFFAPEKEDYGFVTGEAFSSRKPVITTHDSGGPAELVKHGETGFVCEPDPVALAEKMDQLAEDETLARNMGDNAHTFISKITWEKTVKKLVVV